MKTEVTTQKVVTVGMTLEEWIDEMVDPEALLVKIENATLAVIETHDNGKDHHGVKSPRRPKARKAAGHRTTRKIEKTGNFFECPQCPKRFRKQGWLTKHIERDHAASPAAG